MKKLFLFVSAALFSGAVAAQERPTVSYKVGMYTITLLSEGGGDGNPEILIGATPQMLSETMPDGTYAVGTNAFLVRTPEMNILVDAGYGRELFKNLSAEGLQPADIGAILLTHMHGDHIGGLLQEGEVAFPNAKLYVPKPEYDYWMSDAAMNALPQNRRGAFAGPRRVIAAYGDKVRTFKPGTLGIISTAVVTGIQGLGAYGHTPGHTVYLIESNKEKFMIWADLTHAMNIQMRYPEVAVTYDTDPAQAIRSRLAVIEYAIEHRIPVAGMHVPYPAMGTVQMHPKGKGYVFTPVSAE